MRFTFVVQATRRARAQCASRACQPEQANHAF
ncbi:Uncharacterised protein [Klebsiella pneumoniae]|nr:Uncharacterised protein [Klebsiella pneumoniae]